ncbi:MAG: hypothetical protein EBV32_00365 [Proteobacteria bacterium]|uniref:Uncharacterized protein n=1 Tax=Candidatus Fonsibacter lacus TaxID=2576439 RepID=A0A964UXE1_9PROT|nr:hypothetical protein [Candidatus Fonsibacter lacus]
MRGLDCPVVAAQVMQHLALRKAPEDGAESAPLWIPCLAGLDKGQIHCRPNILPRHAVAIFAGQLAAKAADQTDVLGIQAAKTALLFSRQRFG